ncbi:MAG TPA: DUF2891 family protein [Ferruginibacter sp.]|jgi:hypothetical protein|nr:DUF2891 family protein [Ferruginibacter sp.]
MNKILTLLLISCFTISTVMCQSKKITSKSKTESSSSKPEDLYSIDANDKITLTLKGASFIAKWNLENYQKEFPSGAILWFNSLDDVKRPKESNPAFYGYFDWHSAVHSHWTMVKLMKMYPDLPEAKQFRSMIDRTLDTANINGEIRFFSKDYNSGFEYPYGQSWLLRLAAELHSWDDPQAQIWYQRLLPLTNLIGNLYFNITYQSVLPDRYGHHENTAFALLNGLYYAQEMKDDNLIKIIQYKAQQFYSNDRNAPVLFEPSDQDFLSANFLEAAIMSRVMDKGEYGSWLHNFLPGLFQLLPAEAFQAQDSKTNSHLKGYNLTKAYCLNLILQQINKDAPGYQKVKDASHDLVKQTLPLLMEGSEDDSHWLGSFILLAITSDQQ